MCAYSEEHGERFHQDIKDFESRYQEQYNENMMEDYIWGLIRESDFEYKPGDEINFFNDFLVGKVISNAHLPEEISTCLKKNS